MSLQKNKGGRPPRAPGEKMTRLSVMLRPIYREALDLLAREQRTSISQALENVLSQALRTKKIEGKPLLEIAQTLAMKTDATPSDRLYRVQTQPFKTPEEQHAVDVWRELDKLIDVHEQIETLSNNRWGRLFFDMVDETYKMGSPAEFCAHMFVECMKQEERGAIIFEYSDSAGIVYVFNLEDYFGEE